MNTETEWGEAIVLMSSGEGNPEGALGSVRWLGPYLIVDPIVVAATFLDGHTGFAVVQKAGVTLTALGTHFWALLWGAESPAAQGAGVCTDLIVAVRGALHRCEKKMLVSVQGGGAGESTSLRQPPRSPPLNVL